MSEKTEIDEFYDLADQYMQEGRYEEAIELYHKLAEINPEDDSILMSLAWAYRDSGRLSDAALCLEKLLEKELKREIFTGFAFDELVKIYRDEGNYERLVAICEAAVAAQPDDVSLLTTLGNSYLGAGKTDRAVEIFEILAKMEPDAPALFRSLGNAHIATGDFEEAEDAYNRAISMEPTVAHRFYNELGNAFSRAEQYDRAETALRRSLNCHPDQPLVHCDLGDVFVRQEKLDDARMSYETAAKLDPASKGGYYNRLGNTLAGEHNHKMAIEAFEKAVSTDPRNPFYYLGLVKSCEIEGFHDKAREAYKKAKSLGIFS
ncbi:MAG: tetratricopeptide repeat protein [Deltaproteobacteria bacterium]|nr:tetratricopeptide repeat protein [Deltaproteobacteria bacterium]